jgi:hypothetical protein
MPLALAALLTASAAFPATLPTCSWNQPGHNPFVGDVVAAVDRYQDIPAPVRARLKARMASRSYDEIVDIRRDAIVGKARYRPEIRDMHFGSGQVCGTVNRVQWHNDAQERGLVYCEAGHCILVPTVCRNVSRITRESPAVASAGAGGGAVPAGGGGGGGGEVGGGSGGGSVATAAAPADGADGQEAAAPTSFVAGLNGSVSAGSGGQGAGDATPAGVSNTFDSGSVWPARAAAGAPPVDSTVNEAVTPSHVSGAPGDSGVPLYDPSSGLPGVGGGPIGGLPVTTLAPVAPVPEPGTWALMLGGLAALGWRARRRA